MKRKRKKYTALAQKITSKAIEKGKYQTLEERIEYVESITKNDTCHRPDISCYDVCDSCPMTEHCLCSLNTKTNKKRYRRMIKQA